MTLSSANINLVTPDSNALQPHFTYATQKNGHSPLLPQTLVGPVEQPQKERKTQSFRLDDLKVHVLQIEFDAEEAIRLPTRIGEEPRAYIRDERQSQAAELDDRPLEPGARGVEIVVGRPHRRRGTSDVT